MPFLKNTLLLLLILMLPVISCEKNRKEKKNRAVKAFVSVEPQSFFLKIIGGDRVDVNVLVKPGRSPATYEPTPSQIASLSESDVFFTIGVPFENAFIPKIKSMLSGLLIADTREGIPLRKIGNTNDPHIWLNPILAIKQGENMLSVLLKLDPTGASLYRKNFRQFKKAMSDVNLELIETLEPIKGFDVFVFHPAFGYFMDAYGLRQIPLEIEGKEPGTRQIIEYIEKAKELNIKVIFVQPEFSSKNAGIIAREINAVVVPINPLAGDYIKNLRDMARSILAGSK